MFVRRARNGENDYINPFECNKSEPFMSTAKVYIIVRLLLYRNRRVFVEKTSPGHAAANGAGGTHLLLPNLFAAAVAYRVYESLL